METPIRPAPNTTTSSTRFRSDMIALHSRAASGEPITMIRSPIWSVSFPRGITIPSPRMMAATFESRGSGASRNGVAITSEAAASTSNSTICTFPSAKTSVCRAAGTPMILEMACAVSCSDETIRSTSSCRSRQTSRYSSSVVRTTAFVSGASFFENIAAMRFDSSRDVQAISRPASRMPACCSTLRDAPLPSTVATS